MGGTPARGRFPANDCRGTEAMPPDTPSNATRMINVGDKPITVRTARASGLLKASQDTIARIRNGQLIKGDPLTTARVAGIMAAKRTSDIVPLCHPLPLDAVDVDFAFDDTVSIRIEARVRATAKTGVEMEALVAVTAAGICLYDMAKSIDPAMSLTDICLEEKRGGTHGDYRRPPAAS
jgi:cyclic pyranopterin phosphate synthase